jgi:hypothetical protein
VLKNCASSREPALCGFCRCSNIVEYAALSKTPRALADGLMLAFQHSVTAALTRSCKWLPGQPQPGERRLAFWFSIEVKIWQF